MRLHTEFWIDSAKDLLHRVILVSEATRWDFASTEKQTLIYNGVDLDAFQASPEEVEVLRAELFPDAPNAAILVGVVTRITPEKGIHFLVRAMRELKGRTNVKAAHRRGALLPKRC